MAYVTPQSLSSFEFSLAVHKKNFLCHFSWGGKCHPMHTKPWATLLKQSNVLWDLFPAEATDFCREEKYDFSLSHLPVHWDRHFSSSEKHHWVLSPNWSGPWISLSLDGWFLQYFCSSQFWLRACSKVQRCLIDFPRFGSGPREEELICWGTRRNSSSSSRSALPGSRPLAPRGTLTEITAFPRVGGKATRDGKVKKC